MIVRRYHPVVDDWQHIQCERLGLVYYWLNEVILGGLAIPLILPDTFQSLLGGEDCLFCSFSWIIMGSQEQHLLVRTAIVQHVHCQGVGFSLAQVQVLAQHAEAGYVRHTHTYTHT